MAILHRIRANGSGRTKVAKLSARQAIIEHCKECMGFQRNEVRKCTAPLCALWPFRTKDPPKKWIEKLKKTQEEAGAEMGSKVGSPGP